MMLPGCATHWPPTLLFHLAGSDPQFEVDVGDQSILVDKEQIPNSSRAWVTLQKYAAMATAEAALVVASPDAPLVQPGGIHTARATRPDLSQPTLVFWLFNNHWDVNFAAAQTARKLTYRFTLQLSDRPYPAAARLLAEQANVRPIIVRAYGAEPKPATPVLRLADNQLDARIQPSEKPGQWLIGLINPDSIERTTELAVTGRTIRALHRVNAVGERQEQAALAPLSR